jgi:Zn-dependent protease with chaperone function
MGHASKAGDAPHIVATAAAPAGAARLRDRVALPARLGFLELTSLFLFAMAAAYYGILCGAVFELYRVIELLVVALSRASPVDKAAAAAGIALAVTFLLRIAWRLAVGLLGLVTARYDRLPEAEAGEPLSRDGCPELSLLIDEVGRSVAAPSPDDLRVGASPESYVAEQRRFGLLPRRRLALVLGLPQLEVMTVSELKVILAHEMAHFHYADTASAVFLFRFQQLLRDQVESLAGRAWRWIDPLWWLAAAFYHALLRLAAPLQRGRELRADIASAATCGGDLAAGALLKDWLLSQQFEMTLEAFVLPPGAASDSDAERNVFRAFAKRWREFSPPARDYLAQRLAEEEATDLFDTHPTVVSRLAAMRRYPSRGEEDRRPAIELLPNAGAMEDRLHQALERAFAKAD